MNEIIYLGGESSKQTIYGISLDTIFTTLITIFIFVLGFLINKHFENKKERKNQSDIKSFFILYIESLLEPFGHFINSLNDLSRIVSDLNNRKIKFSETAKLNVDENIVSHLDLFKSFIFNEKIDKDLRIFHLKNILNALITIKKVKENVKDVFYKFNEDLRRYENKLTKSMNSILRKYDMFLSQGLRMNNLEDDVFLKGVKDIISRWHKSENHDFIDITKQNMINPLKEYCRKNIHDERSLLLVPLAIDFNDAYSNIKVLREIYSDVFSEISGDLNSEKKLIEEALIYLK